MDFFNKLKNFFVDDDTIKTTEAPTEPTDVIEENSEEYILNQFDYDFMNLLVSILNEDEKYIRLVKHSNNYLSVMYGNCDIIRFHMGINSKWFSLDMWRVSDENLKNDARFSFIRNKNIRHWRIPIISVDDLKKYSDIILLIVEYVKSNIKENEFDDALKCFPDEINYKSGIFKKNISIQSNEEFPNSYTVIDIETTGLSAENNEIIEFAALKVINDEIVNEYTILIKPYEEISNKITDITGITNEMVKFMPYISEVLYDIKIELNNQVLLGHNVNFDINFLNKKLMENGYECLNNCYIDTMTISRKYFPELPNHKLQTLVNSFGVSKNIKHRALSDCYDTHKCYQYMKNNIDLENIKIKKEKKEIKKTINNENNKIFNSNNYSVILDLNDKSFCLSGNFENMSKKEVAYLLISNGGFQTNDVSKKTDYLIIGNKGNSQWTYGNYGSKIKKAVELQEKGCNIKILNEYEVIKIKENSI